MMTSPNRGTSEKIFFFFRNRTSGLLPHGPNLLAMALKPLSVTYEIKKADGLQLTSSFYNFFSENSYIKHGKRKA